MILEFKFVNMMQTVHEIVLLTFKCEIRYFLSELALYIVTLPNRCQYLVALYYPQDQYNNIGNVCFRKAKRDVVGCS